MKQGQFAKAIDIFDQILSEEDEDSETYALRAMAKIKIIPPNFAAAAFDFNKSLEINPGQEELYIWMSYCLQELNQIEEAIKAYDRLIDLNPYNSNYYLDRGVLKSHIDEEAALLDYVKSLEIAPNPLAYNNRADYLEEKR